MHMRARFCVLCGVNARAARARLNPRPGSHESPCKALGLLSGPAVLFFIVTLERPRVESCHYVICKIFLHLLSWSGAKVGFVIELE